MRWIIDTSAWSRRHRREVAEQLEELLAEEDDVLVLSPAAELEILREPHRAAVGETRSELEAAMEVLEATAETFALAADAMQTLALHDANAHRRPIPDLITAALAHQHGCGIVHLDGDFELLAGHSGLQFEVAQIELDAEGGGGQAPHPAARQRQLRTELAGLVHQMPHKEAEEFLSEVVEKARERVPADPTS